MDIAAARTFLEIVKTGSFVRAAANLNVTQTAVSARIRVLEEQLDRQLFVRNKAGARLTPAGDQFLHYATTMVQIWERALHQVAMPAGRDKVVTIGGEHNLWNPLILDWLVWMHGECNDVAIRAQIDVPDRLIDQVQEGVLDLAVVYAPPHRTGIVTELLIDEKLVAVTTGDGGDPSSDDYVYVDWGQDFAHHHELSFPEDNNPGLFVGLGPLALTYILEAGGAGYFRQRVVAPYIASGKLHLVTGAPSFFYPVYAVCSAQADDELIELALDGLRSIASLDQVERRVAGIGPALR